MLSRAIGQPVTAEVTGGAIENLRQLKQGKVDLTMSTAGLLADAFGGRGRFAVDGAPPLRTLMVLDPIRMPACGGAGRKRDQFGPRRMPQVNSRNAASCKSGGVSAMSIGWSNRLTMRANPAMLRRTPDCRDIPGRALS